MSGGPLGRPQGNLPRLMVGAERRTKWCWPLDDDSRTHFRRKSMGITHDGLSYWQAESEGIELLDTTIGDLLDRRANALPAKETVVYSCYPEFGEAPNLRWTYQQYRQPPHHAPTRPFPLDLTKLL